MLKDSFTYSFTQANISMQMFLIRNDSVTIIASADSSLLVGSGKTLHTPGQTMGVKRDQFFPVKQAQNN